MLSWSGFFEASSRGGLLPVFYCFSNFHSAKITTHGFCLKPDFTFFGYLGLLLHLLRCCISVSLQLVFAVLFVGFVEKSSERNGFTRKGIVFALV